MAALDPVSPPDDAVDEAKLFARIEGDEEDALIGSLIATAIRQCEAFCAQILLQRNFVDRLSVSHIWQRVAVTPVVSITNVMGIPAVGAPFAFPVDAYAIDIDANGDGWVRMIAPGLATRIDVSGVSGVASGWGTVPEVLRQGVLRLVSHLYAVRDRSDDPGPPAAVAALWRPWRRMRIG
jgi:uncharacterized phiE125 gp8 family phage protein